MKLAIVHDYLNQFGGAERVVEVLHEIFPEAPIYTSIYDKEAMPDSFETMDIRTSFMQNLPGVMKHFRKYLIFYPFAFERFDLKTYDLILSSSSAWAKGIKKRSDALHICYCYTPMRFAWMYETYIEREEFGPIIRFILPGIIQRIKMWDIRTSGGVDYFIAISKAVAERIKKFYGRDSTIIYPPIDTSKFKLRAVDKDYYLIVSRLNPYKRIDIAVEAFNKLKQPLKIIGQGPDLKRLKKMAGSNIEFVGKVSDEKLAQYYGECKALIFPGEEDFGITPLEANSAGRPVVAYKAGGALDTVIGGETGIFFEKQTPESLAQAIERFEKIRFNKDRIREHALKFGKEVFKTKIKKFVEEKLK